MGFEFSSGQFTKSRKSNNNNNLSEQIKKTNNKNNENNNIYESFLYLNFREAFNQTIYV